jgi:hypothetical protein
MVQFKHVFTVGILPDFVRDGFKLFENIPLRFILGDWIIQMGNPRFGKIANQALSLWKGPNFVHKRLLAGWQTAAGFREIFGLGVRKRIGGNTGYLRG